MSFDVFGLAVVVSQTNAKTIPKWLVIDPRSYLSGQRRSFYMANAYI